MPILPGSTAVVGPPVKTVAYVNKQFEEGFQNVYPGAFSAANIYAIVQMPGGSLRTLGNLAAVSISTHRDTFPVSSMPYVGPRGFTQGHRMIAGTLIFHTLDRNAFNYGANGPHRLPTVHQKLTTALPHPDELPLFDIHINYVNEVGMASRELILGVRLLDFGKTLSLENLHPVESYSYMAIDYAPMESVISGDPESRTFVLRRAPSRERQPLRTSEGTVNKTLDPLAEPTSAIK